MRRNVGGMQWVLFWFPAATFFLSKTLAKKMIEKLLLMDESEYRTNGMPFTILCRLNNQSFAEHGDRV
jgi:hypothetical protein